MNWARGGLLCRRYRAFLSRALAGEIPGVGPFTLPMPDIASFDYNLQVVPTLTLASLVAAHPVLEGVQFIKVDCEGCEVRGERVVALAVTTRCFVMMYTHIRGAFHLLYSVRKVSYTLYSVKKCMIHFL